MVSRDKGGNWSSLSPELEGGAISVIAVHPQNAKILLTFNEKLGGLGKSADAGKTWNKIAEGFGGETILRIAFNRNGPNIVYALTHENKLYKSNDAGDYMGSNPIKNYESDFIQKIYCSHRNHSYHLCYGYDLPHECRAGKRCLLWFSFIEL